MFSKNKSASKVGRLVDALQEEKVVEEKPTLTLEVAQDMEVLPGIKLFLQTRDIIADKLANGSKPLEEKNAAQSRRP